MFSINRPTALCANLTTISTKTPNTILQYVRNAPVKQSLFMFTLVKHTASLYVKLYTLTNDTKS